MLDRAGFDLWADGYEADVYRDASSEQYPFAGYPAVLSSIYRSVRSLAGKRVLDVGVGTGVLAKRLYDEGYSLTGVDFSPRMLAISQAKMPHALLLQADFSKGLPDELRSAAFDAIVCTYALHHLTDEQKPSFLRLLEGLLAPNGQLLIGDVAFQTREELNACRASCGDEWDAAEFYVVADELLDAFPALQFEKLSHCAGVLRFPPA